MRRIGRGIATVLLALAMMAGITAWTEAPVSAISPHVCAQELGLSEPTSTEASEKMPAILVHGLWSGQRIWNEGQPSMYSRIEGMGDVVPYAFDYEPVNSTWVAEGDTADRLAKILVCFYLMYGKQGIAGAHSMGGLLLRQTLSKTAYGIPVEEAVGLIFTIGTPHKGSQLGGVSYGANFSLCYAMLFGQWDAARLCNTAESKKAVSAMRPKSPELAKLPHFPSTVAVKAIAGEVSQQSVCWKWMNVCLHGRSTGGDMIVSVDSATAQSTNDGVGGGIKVFGCTTPVVVPWATPWCGHKEMLAAKPVQDEVVASIRKYLDSRPPDPSPSASPTPGPSGTPVPGSSATPVPGASATPMPVP